MLHRAVTLIILAFALLLAAPAAAELSDTYAGWAEGPEGFLLTDSERAEWEGITTDEEARRFIDLFWARRDPNLGSPINEFRAQFESRIRYADENFDYDDRRGALTDRGRVLLLLGVPHQAEKRAPTETVELMDDTSAGTDEVRANAELWVYDPARLPDGFKAKGTEILFIFYEEKPESNNYILDRSHRKATRGMRLLSQAPEVYVLHPDLETVPRPVSVPGAEQISAEGEGWLMASCPFTDGVEVIADAGVADASHRPLWVHVELPTDAPVLDTVVGRVLTPTGGILSGFQSPVEPLDAADGARAYHLTFPLDAGSYRIELAGAADGVPQFNWADAVELPPIPADATWLSPIWAGTTAFQASDQPMGTAFYFGSSAQGFKLLPLAGEPLTGDDELSYFLYVVAPDVAEGAAPDVRLKLTLKKANRRLGAPAVQQVPTVQVGDDLYMYGNLLRIRDLGLPPGEYTLELEISDPGSDAEAERMIPVVIAEG